MTADGYSSISKDRPVHSTMQTSFSPSVVDPSHPVTLTVDTNVISTTSHQPCDQDGYSEAKQPAYDLFLVRVSKGQTLVTGNGTEDGGYRAQADQSQGTIHGLDQSVDCVTSDPRAVATVNDHWVIPASEVAKIPVGCYEAPIGGAGYYFPFGNGGNGNNVWPPGSGHGTIATLAVGTTLASCGAAPPTTTPVPPGSGSDSAPTKNKPSRDSTPPLVLALRQSPGHIGHPLALRFTVADDKGYASTVASLYRGTALVWKRVGPLQKVILGQTYTAQWKPTAAGAFKFCVASTDRAGNASRTSCAPLIVSK